MAEKFPTPQERAMQWLLEATEIGGMSRPETALHAYQSGFTAACSFQLLESQLYAMGTYANILQERARIEQVDLNAPLEGGESGEVPQDQPMPQMRGQDLQADLRESGGWTMSYKARIFTRKELKQGLHEYLYSVNRPININAMGDYIYDHYGTETEVEE